MDDEVIILIALKMKLTQALGKDYLIESAHNGRQALEVLWELSGKDVIVKLVITDWLMPGLKGDDLLRQIKKDYPDTRGIMITGQADRDSIEAVKREGLVRAVLDKPWSDKRLMDAIRECLE